VGCHDYGKEAEHISWLASIKIEYNSIRQKMRIIGEYLMNLGEYNEKYGDKITQESERLFVAEFLYPMLGSKIDQIIPQDPFIDQTGRLRRIDFAYHGPNAHIALEVNGETYHAEGIIPNNMFDNNLFRQNEILRLGYKLVRFSYNQLQSPQWRPIVAEILRETFRSFAPELLSEYSLEPNPIQKEALDAIDFYRNSRGWKEGVLVMPTGTGKTILSALDARRFGGKVLFLVHRLDILEQSKNAYKMVWPDIKIGTLTGEVKDNLYDCDVLFASKDTLHRFDELNRFDKKHFSYIIIDEVHHGQSPTYREILKYFEPDFKIGMTATPDRMDRRDIFELFNYNKIYEISLSDVIERGYLVPYTYYGLTDNVDYSQIRYQNYKYRVDDLERYLIIPERNAAIVREYINKGSGDKAIGFCVSIKHAERMAEVFSENGFSAVAIHSESPNRKKLLSDFRENKIQIAFTVDLFNEGVDFPNVRVLLFLRPTESRTVFLQQLGRGLRLCIGKDRVRILDFIGNYKRANQIRKYLSREQSIMAAKENGRTRRKIEYTYSTGCEVFFDQAVEEILNRQDARELGITKDDLKEAYYVLVESLGRKPSRKDLDEYGEYKSSQYSDLFGSWVKFLREIEEYTEASYHYPQGTHLGHILSILKVFGSQERVGTHFDDEYVRLRGKFGSGRISHYRRQIKYKLQAAMELGIISDDRNYAQGEDYSLELTPLGKELYDVLFPMLQSLDLSFPEGEDGISSTRMHDTEAIYNQKILEYIKGNRTACKLIYHVFLEMPAILQMLAYLYHVCRSSVVTRNRIYEEFFRVPFVRQFCDQEGIEEATLEASRHRCPFLLNALNACGIIEENKKEIRVLKLVLLPSLVRPHNSEDRSTSLRRLRSVLNSWPDSESKLPSEDLSILRELFGHSFLTNEYYLKDLEAIME
jgi:superfamily II DNA or RNA helicase